jgi:FkbM family methyltransferase
MQFIGETGQDKWVVEFFNAKRNGYFVDVGAYDGVEGSNTLYLEKILGWNGICVETFLSHFNIMRMARKCILENVAVWSKPTTLFFQPQNHTTRDNQQGIPSRATTLAELFKKHKTPKIIDYINLDIEGSEYEALLGFPFDTHIGLTWTIEHNMCVSKDPTYKNKIKDLMLSKGYIIAHEDVGCKNSNWQSMEDWYQFADYKKYM